LKQYFPEKSCRHQETVYSALQVKSNSLNAHQYNWKAFSSNSDLALSLLQKQPLRALRSIYLRNVFLQYIGMTKQ